MLRTEEIFDKSVLKMSETVEETRSGDRIPVDDWIMPNIFPLNTFDKMFSTPIPVVVIFSTVCLPFFPGWSCMISSSRTQFETALVIMF